MSNEFTFDEKLPGSVKAGYWCCGLSLIVFPLPLSVAAFVLGIVNSSKGFVGHGIGQVCLSVVCGYAGIMFAL